MREKEYEKVKEYQDLAREVGKMWRVRTKVVLVVVGALIGSNTTEIEQQPENH